MRVDLDGSEVLARVLGHGGVPKGVVLLQAVVCLLLVGDGVVVAGGYGVRDAGIHGSR